MGLRKHYRKYQSWKRIVWDAETAFKLPVTTRMKFASKGFSVNEYYWYDLANNDYKDYISEYERLQSRNINGQYKTILDDKIIFEEVVGQYANVPQNYALVNDGIVSGLHGNDLNNDNIIEFLSNEARRTVLKWLDRGGGEGTYVIFCEDGKIVVNNTERDEDYLRNLFSREGKALLCEYITQSEFAASLYPHTTNTLRIVCAKKRGEAKAEFITAVQRVGCEDSIPVDNLSSGGIVFSIDSSTGEIGTGYATHGRMDRIMVPFEKHPDTGELLRGKKIPDWESLVSEIVELTNKLPYLNFIAWDILLTDDGYTIIEGNASSGCGLFQVEHGVRNSKLGDIYRSYDIISS